VSQKLGSGHKQLVERKISHIRESQIFSQFLDEAAHGMAYRRKNVASNWG
jgi:hypothetical protein